VEIVTSLYAVVSVIWEIRVKGSAINSLFSSYMISR
jgi:hypothetical protein